mmetsp:Transcript_6312/g.26212  ORF Transcript_6312/g.26212 Transcript_6312/m.26212 type:complete len:308 (-) Transcript_6312:858-1781(-)
MSVGNSSTTSAALVGKCAARWLRVAARSGGPCERGWRVRGRSDPGPLEIPRTPGYQLLERPRPRRRGAEQTHCHHPARAGRSVLLDGDDDHRKQGNNAVKVHQCGDHPGREQLGAKGRAVSGAGVSDDCPRRDEHGERREAPRQRASRRESRGHCPGALASRRRCSAGGRAGRAVGSDVTRCAAAVRPDRAALATRQQLRPRAPRPGPGPRCPPARGVLLAAGARAPHPGFEVLSLASGSPWAAQTSSRLQAATEADVKRELLSTQQCPLRLGPRDSGRSSCSGRCARSQIGVPGVYDSPGSGSREV